MRTIHSLEQLDAILAKCDMASDDDALRSIFSSFHMDPTVWNSDGPPMDPLGSDYHDAQMALYQRISGRAYALANEETPFDLQAAIQRPFPYSTRSVTTAGQHLVTIGQFLCCLDLAPGQRVLELGPGWGNLTLALAGLGYDVTAVDVEARFCTLIQERAVRLDLPLTVINADFSWVETVTEPFDAIVFFECFHHAADHLALLRALHQALKPGGRVYMGAEPILADFPVPWGPRLDGQSLWSMRKFGWMELGFSDAYFEKALEATGWRGLRCDLPGPGTWILHADDEPIRIAATSPRLGTMTGERTGQGITVSKAAAAGYCLYGPYQALAPGNYAVTVDFAPEAPRIGSGVLDVCVDGGLDVLASVAFTLTCETGALFLSVVLQTSCSDLEVRIWGKAGFTAVITGVSIAPTSKRELGPTLLQRSTGGRD